MRLAGLTWTVLLAGLVACAERAPTLPADPAAAADHGVAQDHPAHDVPPATAPAGATAALRVNAAISFAGFGTARFGTSEQALRDAWGEGIEGTPASEPGGCHYLYPQTRPQGGYGVGFMIEGERFVRIDVDNADIVAPGGARTGMNIEQIDALYPGSVDQQDHKYLEGGRYLRLQDPAGGGEGVLLLETDAAGQVTRWRIGVPPQVDYVEGCS